MNINYPRTFMNEWERCSNCEKVRVLNVAPYVSVGWTCTGRCVNDVKPMTVIDNRGPFMKWMSALFGGNGKCVIDKKFI